LIWKRTRSLVIEIDPSVMGETNARERRLRLASPARGVVKADGTRLVKRCARKRSAQRRKDTTTWRMKS
jgi:hypothetical protein